MTSLLGLAADEVGPALEAGRAVGDVGVANDNSPRQIVLSGATDALATAVEKAKELGAKRTVPLNVAGAYHSALMAPAGERLRAELAKVTFKPLGTPVIANVTAEPHGTDGAGIADLLVQQVSATVRFRESLARAFAMGVERCVEFGPGGVLKGIVRQNDRKKSCLSVVTVDDVKAAAEALAGAAEGA